MALDPAQEVVLADAVVGELNDLSRPWAGLFTAVRSWRPLFGVEELSGGMAVAVVPATILQAALDRKRQQMTYTVWISFQRKFESGDTAGPDQVCAAAQAVNLYFRQSGSLTACPDWHVSAVSRSDVYSLDALNTQTIFNTQVGLEILGGLPS